MDIRGRSLVSGLPKTITVSSYEILEALSETSTAIVEAVKAVLEKTPPELIADISARGIILTGGGALVYGMDKLIEYETGIRTIVADEAESCVALGTGKALDNIKILQSYNPTARYAENQ